MYAMDYNIDVFSQRDIRDEFIQVILSSISYLSKPIFISMLLYNLWLISKIPARKGNKTTANPILINVKWYIAISNTFIKELIFKESFVYVKWDNLEYYSLWKYPYVLRKCSVNYVVPVGSLFFWFPGHKADSAICSAIWAYIIFEIHDYGSEGQGPPFCSWARSQCPDSANKKEGQPVFCSLWLPRAGIHCSAVSVWTPDRRLSEKIFPRLGRFPDHITKIRKEATKVEHFLMLKAEVSATSYIPNYFTIN